MLGGGAPHRHLVRERIPPTELVVVVLLVIVVLAVSAKWWGRRCAARSSSSDLSTSAGLSRSCRSNVIKGIRHWFATALSTCCMTDQQVFAHLPLP